MRPIDADALNKTLQERVGSPTTDILYEINLCIIEAPTVDVPTIDAIPVDWLDDRANDITRAPLYRRYAQMILDEWQQEQEAR